MKQDTTIALIVLLVAAVASCSDATEAVPGPEALVGSWISAGGDVAPGLRSRRDSILVEFGEDGSWTAQYFSGTSSTDYAYQYEVGEADGPIYPITVVAEYGVGPQSYPDTLAVGIFRVDGDRLQLEWAADWNGEMTPPTVEGGFGSTVDEGFSTGAYWIQIYRRRE